MGRIFMVAMMAILSINLIKQSLQPVAIGPMAGAPAVMIASR